MKVKIKKGLIQKWIRVEDNDFLKSEKAKTGKPHSLIIREALEIYRRQNINILGGKNVGNNSER